MAEAESDISADVQLVSIVVKNPSEISPGDFELKVPRTSTIADVKTILKRDYSGNPDPSRQKLIVAGKVLSDTLTLASVFKEKNLNEPQVMHLVVSSFPSSQSISKGSSFTFRSSLTSLSSIPSHSVSRSDDRGSGVLQSPPAESSSAPRVTNAASPSLSGSSFTPSSFQVGASSSHSPTSTDTSLSHSSTSSTTIPTTSWFGLPEPTFAATTNSPFDPNGLAYLQMMYGGGMGMLGLNPLLGGFGTPYGLPFGFQYPGYIQPFYTGGTFPFPFNPQSEQQGESSHGPQLNAPGLIPPQAPFAMLPPQYPLYSRIPPSFPPTAGAPGAAPAGGQVQPQWAGFDPVAQAQGALGQLNVQQGVPQPPNARNQRQGRVILALRLDLMLIFKLIALVFFFNQSGSVRSTLVLSLLALLYYLYQTGALAPIQRWFSRVTNQALGVRLPQAENQNQNQNQNQQQQQPAAPFDQGGNVGVNQDGGAGGNPAHPPAQVPQGEPIPQARRRGILFEIQMFVAGFIASLLPGFQGLGNAVPAGFGNPDDHPHQD